MTELIWEGKYDKGRKVGPPRIGLPFQTVGERVGGGPRTGCRTCSLQSARPSGAIGDKLQPTVFEDLRVFDG
jgi:hypothetical protein